MTQPKAKYLVCKFCRRSFNRTEHLQRHERIHTKEKPFTCACGKAFTRRDLLLRHKRLYHDVNLAAQDQNTSVSFQSAPTPGTQGEDEDEDIVTGPSVDTDVLYNRHERADHGHNNVASQTSSTSGVSQIATMPEDQSGGGGGGDDTLTPPVDTNCSNTAAVETASFSGTSHSDPVHGCVASTPAIANSARHLDSFQLVDQDALVNHSHLGHSPRFIVDSGVLNSSRDYMDYLWDDFNDNLMIDAITGLSTLTDPFIPLCASSTGLLGFESGIDIVPSEDTVMHPIPESADPLDYRSRLPSLEQEDPHLVGSRTARGAAPVRDVPGMPWIISNEVYNHIRTLLENYRFLYTASFLLPSKHTVCRYIEGYFSGFHAHLPFLHIPSVSFRTISPELILAILAVGALYRFQRRQSDQLYMAAYALVQHKVQHRVQEIYRDSTPAASKQPSSNPQVELLQAMTLLIALSTWNHSRLLSDSFALAAQLALLIQEGHGSDVSNTPSQDEWISWVCSESERRTKLAAYSFLNLHSIVYNIAPKLMTAQMGNVFLPSPESHWQAIDTSSWLAARQKEQHYEVDFRTAFANLFCEWPASESLCKSSTFGNYVLIHGIVQQIFLSRHSLVDFASQSEGALSPETVTNIQKTLRNWQRTWNTTKGASVDPASPHGPLSFNSIALFRIALVRLHLDLGPYRGLETRNPPCIAQSLYRSPALPLSRVACSVVLQLVHALGVIIRIGNEFVAKTQAFSWSIVHPICNFECACFLSKWLLASSDALSRGQELSAAEKHLLQVIISILIEAEAGSDSGSPDAFSVSETSALSVRRMAIVSVRIWAQMFGGVNVFDIVNPIGEGLHLYASLLEEGILSPRE
ncbi:hypothetical protein GGP41_001050 [Bipolaris sorokiniana]|uniref:C2H2-type domain-containing protein n=1 Tax=Cochliobolus sativus TaxID=45130 RepID=A0A8H5Z7B3_COCSA|nr:hypothetical protein GGP41_001050 [Bipolaris sorokiniana]